MKVPRFYPNDDTCKAIANISEVAHAQRDGTRNNAFLEHEIEEELAEYVRKVCT